MNIKFWVVGHKGWVKLKMSPFKSLSYSKGDTTFVYLYKENVLCRAKIKSGDCQYSATYHTCKLENLHHFKSQTDCIPFPFWEPYNELD